MFTPQQEEILKMIADERIAQDIASIKNNKIEEAREEVAKKHEKELKKLAEEGKIEERKALIEIMVAEADEAELAVRE